MFRYEEDGEEDAAPEPSPAVHEGQPPPPGTAAHPADPSNSAAAGAATTEEEEYYEDEGGFRQPPCPSCNQSC